MKGTSRQRRAAAVARNQQNAPTVRLRLVVPLVLVCIATGAVFGGWQWWMRQEAGAIAPVPDWEDSFPGEAFSPQATAQQLAEESERVVAQLLEAFPHSPDALNVLARWKYASGDLDTAVEVWRQCLELDPDLSEPLYALGAIAIKEDQYERAIELLQHLRRQNPSDVRVPVLLAEALWKSGRLEEARDLLQRHMRSEATSAEAMVALGQVYLQLRDHQKAVDSYQTALRAVPDLRAAHYGLGQAYARMGEKENARQAMEMLRALAHDELQEESRRSKSADDRESKRVVASQIHDDAARVYRERGRLVEAEEMWRKAVVLDPENTEYWGRLLTLYEETGEYTKGLQVARQLVKLRPDDVDYWMNLGTLSAHLDRPEEALAAVETAIRLDPDNPRCREAYELVSEIR